MEEIRKLKEVFTDLPILFVSISNNDEGFTESKRHFEEYRVLNNLQMLKEQLVRLGNSRFSCNERKCMDSIFRLLE